MQSTVVASDCAFFAQTAWFNQIPDECFDLLVALITLQAEEKLKDKIFLESSREQELRGFNVS